LKYHSDRTCYLTSVRNPDQGQCLMGRKELGEKIKENTNRIKEKK